MAVNLRQLVLHGFIPLTVEQAVMGWMPSCHPTNQQCQSTEGNTKHWHQSEKITSSLSITGLLMDGTQHHLHQFSNVITRKNKSTIIYNLLKTLAVQIPADKDGHTDAKWWLLKNWTTDQMP